MEIVLGFIGVSVVLIANVAVAAVSYGKLRQMVNGLLVADREFKTDCHERHEELERRCLNKHYEDGRRSERLEDRVHKIEVRQ